MSTTVKKKLCWNCEGNVSRQADNCPFCGVYLHREKDDLLDIEEEEETQPLPLYQPQSLSLDEGGVPTPPYSPQELIKKEEHSQVKDATLPLYPSQGWKVVLTPLVFLSAGSIFLLFGLILLLFSQNGMLTLRWNGDYWFVYSLLALPLLYLGWRTLYNISDPS